MNSDVRPGKLSKELQVLGDMAPKQMASKLRELGETRVARGVERGNLLKDPPWKHTAHVFGFIGKAEAGQQFVPIRHVGDISPDPTLRKQPVKISLDYLRVADYPGGDVHLVLFEFYARNQTENPEDVRFNQKYRAKEGEEVGLVGLPIFRGLNVGNDGLVIECATINVHNEDAEQFLAFLDGNEFKSGLQLLTTAQPAIAPFAETVLGVAKYVAKMHRNVPVQTIYMGLDFSSAPTGARLAEGSYVAIQVPQKELVIWDWSKWHYDVKIGRVVNKDDSSKLVPYNYIVFRIDRYTGG